MAQSLRTGTPLVALSLMNPRCPTRSCLLKLYHPTSTSIAYMHGLKLGNKVTLATAAWKAVRLGEMAVSQHPFPLHGAPSDVWLMPSQYEKHPATERSGLLDPMSPRALQPMAMKRFRVLERMSGVPSRLNSPV
jgi:hypothetical protein